MTSLAQLVDSPPTVEEVAHRYAEQFRIVFAEHLSRGASQPARGADHHSHAVGSHAVGSHADGSHADDPHANRSHHETSAE